MHLLLTVIHDLCSPIMVRRIFEPQILTRMLVLMVSRVISTFSQKRREEERKRERERERISRPSTAREVPKAA
jgi:hypothetical protein